ncbi:helicase [Paenibacillus spiritus]|uniref:Helicase n=1 Tax=Paenibacillus spiritus TaxID=2496557 RepID=A0A5J5GD05_9BACL|nr:HRDC domain-containing protein [Paenibacillus spiritus]KAA9005324.1 helicase [Paenibacillus spiritus]
MQIVFMNRLTKWIDDTEEASAVLWIGEEEGVWRLGWRSCDADEKDDDLLWYEGGSWNELLGVYRQELAARMGEGYRPIIGGVFHEEETFAARTREQLKLQYYSEQYADERIYEELCGWRRRRSGAERKAPYLLASNRLLKLLSAFLPRTQEELLQIPGVGEAKAAQYGPELLAITGAAERERGFPLDWVAEEVADDAFACWMYKRREEKYRKQLEQMRLRRSLLQGIADGSGIAALAADSSCTRREVIEALEELEREGYLIDPLLDRELEPVPQAECEAVLGAFRALGTTFLKPVLHQVYGQGFAPEGGLDLYYERLRLLRIIVRREQTPGAESSGAASGM